MPPVVTRDVPPLLRFAEARARRGVEHTPDTMMYKIVKNPPALQGAVPRTHQAHQDQLSIPLAELILKAGHWNPRPAASGSLGLIYFFPALRSTRAPNIGIGQIYTARRDRDRP